jgi:hypothetical protein
MRQHCHSRLRGNDKNAKHFCSRAQARCRPVAGRGPPEFIPAKAQAGMTMLAHCVSYVDYIKGWSPEFTPAKAGATMTKLRFVF